MQVLKEHPDGTRTLLYEPGDRVRFRKTAQGWLWPEVGALGTVVRRDKPGAWNDYQPSSIDWLEVQTDYMKEHGFGALRVPPWYLEPVL